MAKAELIPVERIEKAILQIRGQKVMLDRDLAALYGVPTKRLNEQVRRNRKHFPEDFMFQLTAEEAECLRSQIATSNPAAKLGMRSQIATTPLFHIWLRKLRFWST
jgi:hypothetical protein